MKLNCDLGESFAVWQMGNDHDIMPLIQMANIACGFHAGDALIMAKTVALAKSHQVEIGAHPSYQDLPGFGRRSISYSSEELTAIIHYQIGALSTLCQSQNTQVSYVKPHGALYNDMMKSLDIFETICQTISTIKQPLKLVIQAIPDTTAYQTIAEKYHVPLLFEAFADRNYQANGLLTPRSKKNAVITNIDDILQRYQHLIEHGQLISEDGTVLTMQVDTLCVHGDNDEAVAIVKTLNSAMYST